jgi:riboflavin synthase
VEKGSITLDGISLTVGKSEKNSVIVYLIPHTLKMTTFGSKRTGDALNIEFDIIGKYTAKLFENKRFS